MEKVKAKKHLGQHFLKDESIAQAIADTLNLQGYDDVLEIGPGMGVLTKYLLDKPINTYVIEIDTESVTYLDANYPKLKDKIISNMPQNIWLIKLMAPIFNNIKNIPILNKVIEWLFNFSTKRTMPDVQNINPLKDIYYSQKNFNNKVILLADTFNINFEIHNLIYAIKVLNKFDYKAIIPNFDDDSLERPLCCGRTYISHGQLDKAQAEMQRFTNYIINNNYTSTPVVGIEPSCLLTFNDEYNSLKNIENKIPHAHIHYFDIKTLDYLADFGLKIEYEKTLQDINYNKYNLIVLNEIDIG